MARTVHHTAFAHRDSAHARHADAGIRCSKAPRTLTWSMLASWACDYRGPEHAVTNRRYSALTLAVADRTGTRPIPVETVVTFERVTGVRSFVDTSTAGERANQHERAARSRLRDETRALTGYANAILSAPGRADADADVWDALADLADPAPTTHRRSGLWDCW